MKLQVARKKHECCLCEGEIPKGSKYWRHTDFDAAGNMIVDRKEHTNCPEVKITAAESDFS